MRMHRCEPFEQLIDKKDAKRSEQAALGHHCVAIQRTSQGLELFGGSLEEVEGLCGFGGDGFGGVFEFVGDFEDAGGVGREGGDVFRYVLPVDACSAGPEVVVSLAEVVVDVELGDAGL